jgi:hypothetical protein
LQASIAAEGASLIPPGVHNLTTKKTGYQNYWYPGGPTKE